MKVCDIVGFQTVKEVKYEVDYLIWRRRQNIEISGI